MPAAYENEQEKDKPEKKKISLEEAIRQKLASKKQEKNTNNHKNHDLTNPNKMKHQQTKKHNNQRRRTGV